MPAPVRLAPLVVTDATLEHASDVAEDAGEVPFADAVHEIGLMDQADHASVDALYHWLSHPDERVLVESVRRWGRRILEHDELRSILQGQMERLMQSTEWCPLMDWVDVVSGAGRWSWDLAGLEAWLQEKPVPSEVLEVLTFQSPTIWSLVARRVGSMNTEILARLREKAEIFLEVLQNDLIESSWKERVLRETLDDWGRFSKIAGDAFKAYVIRGHGLPRRTRMRLEGLYAQGGLEGTALDALLADPGLDEVGIRRLYLSRPEAGHALQVLTGLAHSERTPVDILRALAEEDVSDVDRVLCLNEKAMHDVDVRAKLLVSDDILVLRRVGKSGSQGEWIQAFSRIVELNPESAIEMVRRGEFPQELNAAKVLMPLLRHGERRIRVLAIAAMGHGEYRSGEDEDEAMSLRPRRWLALQPATSSFEPEGGPARRRAGF